MKNTTDEINNITNKIVLLNIVGTILLCVFIYYFVIGIIFIFTEIPIRDKNDSEYIHYIWTYDDSGETCYFWQIDNYKDIHMTLHGYIYFTTNEGNVIYLKNDKFIYAKKPKENKENIISLKNNVGKK